MTRAGHTLLALLATLTVFLSACGGGGREPAGQAGPGDARVVRVAAASDLKFALEEIKKVLAHRQPELEVKVTFGSSGTFLSQISNGAPFDLYLSADLAYPRQLVDQGLAARGDLFSYAVGRLVLWTPERSSVDPAGGLTVLADRHVRRIAIANPGHAPYGRAAVAAMKQAGVYDAVQGKLVLGENVAQAAEFVQSGGADAGVVAMSLVLADPLRNEGRWVAVRLRDYPRLDQGGVVLHGAGNPQGARAVRDAMLGEQGRAVLKRYGFFLPAAG